MATTPASSSAPAPPADAGLERRLDMIDAVIYADVFDCAATAEELWRFSRLPMGREEFQRRLSADPAFEGILSERDGLYCLAGREALLARRPPARERARRLRRRARLVALVLQHMPFVRGLLVTGSAGADDAGPDADVDLLVLVRTGRLSLTFTLLGGLSRILSRRVFCPNHYISASHPALAGPHNLYLAREVVQARALTGAAESVHSANGWVRSLLPNASARSARVRPLPGGALLQGILEWPLRGPLGDRVDRRLRSLALARLREHHRLARSAVPDDVVGDLEAGIQLRFHGCAWRETALGRHRARRQEVAARLGELADAPTPGRSSRR